MAFAVARKTRFHTLDLGSMCASLGAAQNCSNGLTATDRQPVVHLGAGHVPNADLIEVVAVRSAKICSI
jgi:hypothetical protein